MIRTDAIAFNYSHIAHPESVPVLAESVARHSLILGLPTLGETIGSSSKREQYRRLEAG